MQAITACAFSHGYNLPLTMPLLFVLLLQAAPAKLLSLGTVDLLVIALYFVMCLGIGLYLKRFTNTGEEFFLAGRDMSAWVAGLSFVAAASWPRTGTGSERSRPCCSSASL